MTNYIGTKGYSLFKKNMTEKEKLSLKQDLIVYPKSGLISGPIISYPVYIESDNKFYIPKFYGIQKYGVVPSKLIEADKISLDFIGTLRPMQEEVVKTFMDNIQKQQQTGYKVFGGLLELYTGAGKCLKYDTPIIMYDGSIKMVQDVKIGDEIMGDDSTPRNILSLARGREKMYKISNFYRPNESYTVNESHILSLKNTGGLINDISVLDYLSIKSKSLPLYGYKVSVIFSEKTLPIDPYIIGYWLGDKYSHNSKISCKDPTVFHYFYKNLPNYNLSLFYSEKYYYEINSDKGLFEDNILLNTLKELNMIENKHIPPIYKCNSRENRLNLLAGLLDSAGVLYDNNIFAFTQKNEVLIDDVIYLARSLGFSCYKQPKNHKSSFRICISGEGFEMIPTLNPKKRALPKRQFKDVLRYQIKIEELDIDDYFGFEIDGNHRFLLGDFTVTHNTITALNLISLIKEKTLIVVHKEFLLNQWIERITQCLPSAKVGRIQGSIIDIEGKDIVIGMLQSLSMKEYPDGTFNSFGIMVVDEVHHISSEVFSRALFKIVTKYTIGLSATMNRKDGTSNVFKMFLGDIVYKSEKNGGHEVEVRKINYTSTDEEFNKVVVDYKGNPQYSSMISKLCCFNPRTEFILNVIIDMRKEDPSQQIIVLAHNRCLLEYIYQAIEHRNICTTGYYLGGMKANKLKESESKQLIAATYSMAAEALDIPTLTTLILLTPKTDIVQAVGRILRMKHKQRPLVIDIVDSHQLFKNQYKKREKFYKDNEYKIITSSNLIYNKDTTCWRILFNPSKKNDIEEVNEEDSNIAESVKIPKKCMINLKKNAITNTTIKIE